MSQSFFVDDQRVCVLFLEILVHVLQTCLIRPFRFH